LKAAITRQLNEIASHVAGGEKRGLKKWTRFKSILEHLGGLKGKNTHQNL